MEDKKIVLITGSNSGIGKVTASEIAKDNFTVVMVCRNKEKGEKALEEIKRYSGNNDVHLMICDLSDFISIKAFSKEFIDRFNRLDILINNAGTMHIERKLTIDNFEMHFQVNYLAPFLLTTLLLNVIVPNGRIINVSSLAHRFGRINFDDINLSKRYSGFKAYGQSKLALVLFTYELSKRLKDKEITVNCLHPGVILSNLGIYKDKRFIDQITRLFKGLFTSAKKGAETSIYLALSSDVSNITGKYFYKKQIRKSSKLSYNETLAKILWNKSFEWLNLNENDYNIL